MKEIKINAEHLQSIIGLFHGLSERNKKDAQKEKDDFLRGMYQGYSAGYKTAENWVKAIMEGRYFLDDEL